MKKINLFVLGLSSLLLLGSCNKADEPSNNTSNNSHNSTESTSKELVLDEQATPGVLYKEFILDGTYMVDYNASTFKGKELYISSTCNGVPVSLIGGVAFKGVESLEKVTIPGSVIEIIGNSFQNCKNLKTVNILGSGLQSLGNHTFANCASLEKVTLPSSLKTIELGCFEGCKSLREIVIPKSVESIPSQIFDMCENLNVFCEAESKPTVWSNLYEPSISGEINVYYANEWEYDSNGNPKLK